MKVSFVIRTKNESKWIKDCLDRIYSQECNLEIEVIVVDSGSQDNTVLIAQDAGAKIIYYDKKKWSWGRAINLGLHHATGDLVVVISAHCLISSRKFLRDILEVRRNYSNAPIGAIYIRQEPIMGWNILEELDTLSYFPCYNSVLKLNKIRFAVSNSCVVIDKAVWKKIPFNEDILSGEDGFWAAEVLREGYLLLYLPYTSVYHSHYFSVIDWYRRYYGRYLSFWSLVERHPLVVPYIEYIKNRLVKFSPSFMIQFLAGMLYMRDFKDYSTYIKEKYPNLYESLIDKLVTVLNVKKRAFEEASKVWKFDGDANMTDYYVNIPRDVLSLSDSFSNDVFNVRGDLFPNKLPFH